jgi:hypothetical protein
MTKTETPSLDEIAANPARAAGLSEPIRLQMIARCAAILFELTKTQDREPADNEVVDDGQLLTPEELAALMRVKLSWVYRHGHDLPFAVRLPGQRRVKRYSYAGFEKYIRARRGR